MKCQTLLRAVNWVAKKFIEFTHNELIFMNQCKAQVHKTRIVLHDHDTLIVFHF